MAKTTPSAKSKTKAPKANTVKWWLMKLPEPIRNAGDSQVTISLYAGVKVTMTVHVTAIR